MSTPDVTVFGAGIFGLSVAWACIKRGARVQVIDPNGVAAGSSGGIVGALAPHTPENWNDKKQFQFESLIMSQDWWAEIKAVGGGDPGYVRSGRIQPLVDARALDLAQRRVAGADTFWKGHAEWRIAPAVDWQGWAPETPGGLVIFDTLSARLHPGQACKALAAAIMARGGVILSSGTSSGVLIYATGYQGLLDLNQELDQAVGGGVKGQALLLQFDARNAPQLFVDGLHIVPHADGTCAIGSTSERVWDAPASTDAQLEDIRTRAVAALPMLQPSPVIGRWAGIRPRTRSRAPMLGHYPGRAGAFLANGGFKIGFGMAPKMGEVMADLVLEGRDAIPAGFRPEASLKAAKPI